MTVVPFPVFAPTVDAFYQTGDPDFTAAFTRGFAVSPRLYGTPGKIYVVNGLTLNGQQFDGRGCIVQDAAGAPYCFRLTGWKPMVKDVEFDAQGNVEKKTTNVGGFAQGATSIVVASALGVQVGQQILIQGNSNAWMQTQVASVAGATIGLAQGTTEAGSAGLAVVASFGLVHLADSQHARLEELLMVNVGVGIVCAPLSADISNPDIRNVQFDGVRYCALAKYGNTHDGNFGDIEGFCGATDTFTYTATGAAGPFNVVYANDLIRDVTVSVNGTAQPYGTAWTFTSDFLIQFASGSIPAAGATVTVQHYHCGVRGFVEDQRGATVSGGNQIHGLRFLKCIIAMELQQVTLSNYSDVIVDTNMLQGVLMNGCGFDCNFTKLSSTWARQPIAAYSSDVALFALTTDLTPSNQVNPYLGVNGPEIFADGASFLDVDLAQWESQTYLATLPPNVNFLAPEKINFGSLTTVAGGASAYLTPFGQSNVNFPADLADRNKFLIAVYFELNVAPGTGQTVTLSIVRNADAGSPITSATCVVSGANYGGFFAITPSAMASGDRLFVEIVYSAGAAPSYPRGFFVTR